MDFISSEIQKYAENHTSGEPVVLQKLNRETYAKVLTPRMLSGHLQGRVLSMFTRMIKPKNVLEIGTYTGYSALCMAEGLQSGGKIYTIDINEELEDMVKSYFAEAGVDDCMEYLIGNAVDIIPTLDVAFDLVFIDADKVNYSNYYDMVIDKLSPGAFIIADNVLWSGKVIEEGKKDKDTQGIVDFNDKVHNDPRVEHVLFPVRDGLMVVQKIA